MNLFQYIGFVFFFLLFNGCDTEPPAAPLNNSPNIQAPPINTPPINTPPINNPPFNNPPNNPPNTPPIPPFVEWTKDEKNCLAYSHANCKLPAQPGLTFFDSHEKDLEAVLDKKLYWDMRFNHTYTIENLASVPSNTIDKISLVFLNTKASAWQNPLVGEVRLVNQVRYQMLAAFSDSDYAVVIASKNYKQIVQFESNGYTSYFFTISVPWPASAAQELGKGAQGEVLKVQYSNRTFIAKKSNSQHDFLKELKTYEALNGIKGIGPYLGFVGEYILMEQGVSIDKYLKQNPGQNMIPFFKPLLETLQQMHDKGWYHNDIKIGNMLIVNNAASLIDFGNSSQNSWRLGRGHGFTYPYYEVGEYTGKKADIKALGFCFVAMKHHDNASYAKYFSPKPDEILLKASIRSGAEKADLITQLRGGDQWDKLIARMLDEELKDAAAVIAQIP